MKIQMTFGAYLLLGALLIAGCAEPPPAAPRADNAPVVVQTVEVVPPKGDAASTPDAPSPSPPSADENADGVVAQVGFGGKGHYESSDYISTTVAARFRVEERLVLGRIQNALQQYKAIHEHFPKTHEIFMKEIIEAHGIKLPELRAGEEYRYDPELAKQTSGEDSLRILIPKK